MFCQRCGTKNSEGAAFCSGCGAPLQAQGTAIFCQKCGAPGQAGQRFCASCGASLAPGPPPNVASPTYTPPAQPVQAAAEPRRGGTAGRWIAVIVVALVVGYVVNRFLAVPQIRLAFQLARSTGSMDPHAIYQAFRLIVYAVVVGLALKLFGR